MFGSKISWTDHTFNPWMGCVKVSPGCAHCYAETLTRDRMGLSLWGKDGARQVTTPDNWKNPVKWNRLAQESGVRARVFCASLCDVFEDHPTANAARPRLWDLIRGTPWLDWQLLTKRPERIADNLPPDWMKDGSGWPHVWLGTSIENNDFVGRAEELRKVDATVRFVSYEPALGPLDALDLTGIDWVIYGGESGSKFRPHDLAWPRQMRDMCAARGRDDLDRPRTAFFFKQSSAYRTEMGTTLDGQTIQQYPRRRLPVIGSVGVYPDSHEGFAAMTGPKPAAIDQIVR